MQYVAIFTFINVLFYFLFPDGEILHKFSFGVDSPSYIFLVKIKFIEYRYLNIVGYYFHTIVLVLF